MMKQAHQLGEQQLVYSLKIIKIDDQLSITKASNHLAGYLQRLGSSPYSNHGEAQAAGSSKQTMSVLEGI